VCGVQSVGMAIMKQNGNSKRTRRNPPADLTGMRFGKWTVLKYAGKKSSKRMWLCRCDCGVQKQVTASSRTSIPAHIVYGLPILEKTWQL
jgi:hypothetical protein